MLACLSALCIMAIIPRLALADDGAMDILTKMIHAEKNTYFVGILTTKESGERRGFTRATKLKLWHAPDGKFRLVPIEPKELSDTFIVDDGEHVYHVFPKRNEYVVRPSSDSWIMGPMLRRLANAGGDHPRITIAEFIKRNGVSVLDGGKQVAGRDAIGLTFHPESPRGDHPGPRLPRRAGRQATLWIDAEKHVALAFEMKNADGNIIQRVGLESVDFPQRLDASLFEWSPKPGMKEVTPPAGAMPFEQAARRLGFKRLARLGYVAGYTPEHPGAVDVIPFGGRRGDAGPGVPVAVMVYVSGSNRLSFFQSAVRALAFDIPDRDKLKDKVSQLKRGGFWDEATHSYTWIQGDGGEQRLLRIQAPADMSRGKVEEIAKSTEF